MICNKNIHKKLFAILLGLLYLSLSPSLLAQKTEKSVFVLVDLSSNLQSDPHPINDQMRQEAANLSESLINGTFKPSDYPNWQSSGIVSGIMNNTLKGNGTPLIGIDDFLMIMPFGRRSTSNNFKINQIKRYPTDLDNFYQIDFEYNEPDTWGNLAEAKACNIAFNHNIPEYYIIRIQGRPDDPNSASLSSNEQTLIDSYETSANPNTLLKLRHQGADDYSISVSEIDITKMPGLAKQQKVKVASNNVDKKVIQLLSPKGSKKKPFQTKNTAINISWNCLGCDDDPNTNFKIQTLNVDTKKTKTFSAKTATSKLINLEPGNYRIKIHTSATVSNPAYISIGNKSSGSFLLILFLIIMIALAVFFGHKKWRENQTNKTRPKKEWEDSFNENNNSNPTNSSDSDW